MTDVSVIKKLKQKYKQYLLELKLMNNKTKKIQTTLSKMQIQIK